MTRLPFYVVILLLLSTHTVAEIKSLTISNDSRPVIVFENFRVIEIAHVTISVSSASVSSSPLSSPITDSSKLGFFVLSDESLPLVLLELQQNLSFCILDSHYILHFFTFSDLSPPPRFQFNQSYPITSPDDYALYFANCLPETMVSMKVQTEIYNLNPNGSKDYLHAGSTQLPGLYFFFSLCYLTFLCFWLCFCWNNKQIVKRIHLLMMALLLTKSLTLICAAEYKHYVKVTGTAHGWNILFYIFNFIRDVLFYMVIVLVGTGWSFLKPKLQGKEKKLLMIVVPVQVLANIASVVIGETGPFIEDWVIWNQIFLLADITSCFAIIFTMVWSMCCQRETSKTDGKVVKNLAKLPLFRKFYILVIVYLFFTRIGVFALKMIADYKFQWVSYAAEEIASLAFYILMFYMFRPMERNEYFDVDDEEETAEFSLNNHKAQGRREFEL